MIDRSTGSECRENEFRVTKDVGKIWGVIALDVGTHLDGCGVEHLGRRRNGRGGEVTLAAGHGGGGGDRHAARGLHASLGESRCRLGSETANRRRGPLAGDRRGGRHGSHALFARKVRRAAVRRYGSAQNSGARWRTTIGQEDVPSRFCHCRVGSRGELRDRILSFFNRLISHMEKFIEVHPETSSGIFIFLPRSFPGCTNSEQQISEKFQLCSRPRPGAKKPKNVFVGVCFASPLRKSQWKERARIDAAPGPERKAFDIEE